MKQIYSVKFTKTKLPWAQSPIRNLLFFFHFSLKTSNQQISACKTNINFISHFVISEYLNPVCQWSQLLQEIFSTKIFLILFYFSFIIRLTVTIRMITIMIHVHLKEACAICLTTGTVTHLNEYLIMAWVVLWLRFSTNHVAKWHNDNNIV